MKFCKTEKGIVVEHCNAKFIIEEIYHGCSMSDYNVELLEGDWPSDNDLITICDGDEPPHCRHFGGNVLKNDRQAKVTVYTD